MMPDTIYWLLQYQLQHCLLHEYWFSELITEENDLNHESEIKTNQIMFTMESYPKRNSRSPTRPLRLLLARGTPAARHPARQSSQNLKADVRSQNCRDLMSR
jgi:hypothetical protein